MTSTSTTTNSVFQAFIEAQHALEQLPAVEAELASLKGENETIHRAWDEAELKAMSLEDELKAVRSDLAAKEEALAQAMFREKSVSDKLAVIQSVIGVPQPQPVVESNPVAGSKSDAGESAADPTTEAHTSNTGMIEQASSSASDHPEASPAGTSGEGQGTANTETGDGSQSQSVHTDTANDGENAGSQQSSPRLPYWRKPADLAWSDWVSQGNEPAPWLHEDHTDPHAIATK